MAAARRSGRPAARRRPLAAVVLAVAVALAAACGTGSPGEDATATPGSALPIVKPQFEVASEQPVPGELVVEELAVGEGPRAEVGDTLRVHYVGRAWSTGREFAASWDRGQPLTFELGAGQVIAGLERGLRGMHVGGRRRVVVPPGLAYGDRGAGQAIAPGETLVFVVDLLDMS